jgi:hypothetical protein
MEQRDNRPSYHFHAVTCNIPVRLTTGPKSGISLHATFLPRFYTMLVTLRLPVWQTAGGPSLLTHVP